LPSGGNAYREPSSDESDSDDDEPQSPKSMDDGEEDDGEIWVDCLPSQPASQGALSEALDGIISDMGNVTLDDSPEDSMDVVNKEQRVEMDMDDVQRPPPFIDEDPVMGDTAQAAPGHGRETGVGSLESPTGMELVPICDQMVDVDDNTSTANNLQHNGSGLLPDGAVFPHINQFGQPAFTPAAPAPQATGFNAPPPHSDVFSFNGPAPQNNRLVANDLVPQWNQGAATNDNTRANNGQNFNFNSNAPVTQNLPDRYSWAETVDRLDTEMTDNNIPGNDVTSQQQPSAQNDWFQDELLSTGMNFIQAFNANNGAANGDQAPSSTMPQTMRPQIDAQSIGILNDMVANGLDRLLGYDQMFNAGNTTQPLSNTVPQTGPSGYEQAGQPQVYAQNTMTRDESVSAELDRIIASNNQNPDAADENQGPRNREEKRPSDYEDASDDNLYKNTKKARLDEMPRKDLEKEIKEDLLKEGETDSVYGDEISHRVKSPARSDYGNGDEDAGTVYDGDDDVSSAHSGELNLLPPPSFSPILSAGRFARRLEQEQQERNTIPGLTLDRDTYEEEDSGSDASSVVEPENPELWNQPGYLRGRIEQALRTIEPAPNSLIPRMEVSERTGRMVFRECWVLENPAWLRTMAGQNYLLGNPWFVDAHCWEIVHHCKRIRRAARAARKEQQR